MSPSASRAPGRALQDPPSCVTRPTAATKHVPIFLGTVDPRINIERVSRRVLEGGHHVPEHEIRRRWTRAFENLLETWDVFERIDVLDSSTENVHRVAGKHHGRIHTVATGLPRWARPIAIR